MNPYRIYSLSPASVHLVERVWYAESAWAAIDAHHAAFPEEPLAECIANKTVPAGLVTTETWVGNPQ